MLNLDHFKEDDGLWWIIVVYRRVKKNQLIMFFFIMGKWGRAVTIFFSVWHLLDISFFDERVANRFAYEFFWGRSIRNNIFFSLHVACLFCCQMYTSCVLCCVICLGTINIYIYMLFAYQNISNRIWYVMPTFDL